MKRVSAYKKSILTGIGFLFFGVVCKAQDSAAVMTLLHQKEYARAKEAADKLAVENEVAENYLLKAVVYDSVAKSPAAGSLVADARWQAFAALQKAALIKNEYVFKQGQELARDLYNGFITEGLVNFNMAAERNEKVGFETALLIFKKAEKVNAFLHYMKWDSVLVHPLLLSFISKAAIYSENEVDALFYCNKMIDEITLNKNTATGNEIIYHWLLYYYNNSKDVAAFTKYLELAKAAYPANKQYFLLAEIDWLRQQQDYKTLFARYDELIAGNDKNDYYKMAYCMDIFNSLWPKAASGYKTPAELIALLKPVTTGKEKAAEASLLLAKTYINMAQDVLSDLKLRRNAKPAVIADYKTQYKKLLLLSNQYLQKIIVNKANLYRPERKEAKRLQAANSKALINEVAK